MVDTMKTRVYIGSALSSPEYMAGEIDEFKGNPLVEALPQMKSKVEIAKFIKGVPEMNEKEINHDPMTRSMYINRLYDFFTPLPTHLKLYQKIDTLIRRGYIKRNFMAIDFEERFYYYNECRLENKNISSISNKMSFGGYSNSMLIIGDSGMGKSLSTERILRSYPQVIRHSQYKGVEINETQIVWLKIDCPFDGSVKGLCINFFRTLDSVLSKNGKDSYEHLHGKTNQTINKMFSSMVMLASRYHIGILVIDEIQYALEAGKNIKKFLQFLVTLENTIGIPTVYIGTAKTEKLINTEFTVARRLSAAGTIVMKRLENDDNFEYFIENMWKYQWLKNPIPLNKELLDEMYNVTQGILSVCINLFIAVQLISIEEDVESITTDLINVATERELRSIMPMLAALRLGDYVTALHYDDLIIKYDVKQLEKLYSEIDLNRHKDFNENQNRSQAVSIDEAKKSVYNMILKYDILKDLTLIEVTKIIDKIVSKNRSLSVKEIVEKSLLEALSLQKKKDTKRGRKNVSTMRKGGLLEALEISVSEEVDLTVVLRSMKLIEDIESDLL